MTKPEDVEAYIAQTDSEARPVLEELREVIRSTVPQAEEAISYNVPFYRFDGVHVGFSAATNHATFGIGADALDGEDRERLEEMGYGTGKETVKIRYDQTVPREELERLLEKKVERARSPEG